MGLALVFAGGIACGLAIPCPTAAFILLASVALAAALLYRRTAWLVHAAIFLAGWIAADLEIRTPSPADVRRVLERDREYATAIGVVIADPAPAQGGTEPLWFVPLRLEGLRRAEAWQKVRGEVRVLWRYTAGQERPAYGDRWLVAGPFVVTTDKAQVQLYADPGAARRLGSGGGWRAMAWCLRGRERCAEILSRGIAGYTTEAGFIRAMMLGLREDLPDPVYRAFAETGTLHVVAISGTHIAVAALIFAALLRSTGLSQRYWIVVLAPMLVLYTL
ncbi:MAG TPA: ComEC/Rec2 family competence protein, partial [Kiritimatiellia bacterium]